MDTGITRITRRMGDGVGTCLVPTTVLEIITTVATQMGTRTDYGSTSRTTGSEAVGRTVCNIVAWMSVERTARERHGVQKSVLSRLRKI